jgi:hypothetical protein
MTDTSKASPYLATPAALSVNTTPTAVPTQLSQVHLHYKIQTHSLFMSPDWAQRNNAGVPLSHLGHQTASTQATERTNRATTVRFPVHAASGLTGQHSTTLTPLSCLYRKPASCSVSQSVPSARHFHGNPPMATTLTRAASLHLYIQTSRLSLSSICILRLHIPSGILPSGFRTKTVCVSFSPLPATRPHHPRPLSAIIIII